MSLELRATGIVGLPLFLWDVLTGKTPVILQNHVK